jgi:hypothetical protein
MSVVAAHKQTYATREYFHHEPFVVETYRAILSDGSVVGISPATFNSFQGDRGYLRTEQTGLEAPESWGIPFEEFKERAIQQVRPCTCGSGEYWATCGANSPYCG